MSTVDNLLDGSATIKESAEAFIEDPLTFFDMSLTKMQSVPRDLLEELQTEALSMRFEQQKRAYSDAVEVGGSAGNNAC